MGINEQSKWRRKEEEDLYKLKFCTQILIHKISFNVPIRLSKATTPTLTSNMQSHKVRKKNREQNILLLYMLTGLQNSMEFRCLTLCIVICYCWWCCYWFGFYWCCFVFNFNYACKSKKQAKKKHTIISTVKRFHSLYSGMCGMWNLNLNENKPKQNNRRNVTASA